MLSNSSPEIAVARADFIKSLKLLKSGLKKRSTGSATLRNESGTYRLELTSASTDIAAEGNWPGAARFSLRILSGLLRVPPRENPVVIRYEAGRIIMGSSSVKAEWMDIHPEPLQLPSDATLIDLVRAKRVQNAASIAAAGLTERLDRIEAELERELKLVASHFQPAMLSLADLQDLVEAKVTESPDNTLVGQRLSKRELKIQDRMESDFRTAFRRLRQVGISGGAVARLVASRFSEPS